MTKKILENLKFSRETIEKTVKMVRWHMFFSDTEQVTLSAVRRIIANVGKENIWDLMNVRSCDRIGMGRPKRNSVSTAQISFDDRGSDACTRLGRHAES